MIKIKYRDWTKTIKDVIIEEARKTIELELTAGNLLYFEDNNNLITSSACPLKDDSVIVIFVGAHGG